MKNIGRIIQKFSKNYWTKDSILIESFFDSMKTWLDIYEKGWKSRKNDDFNQPVDKESRPLSTFIINGSSFKGGGGGGLSKWRTGPSFFCEAHFFAYSLPFLSRPSILLTIFTITTTLPSSKTLPNSLLSQTHKLSHISISEMPDSIKFQ